VPGGDRGALHIHALPDPTPMERCVPCKCAKGEGREESQGVGSGESWRHTTPSRVSPVHPSLWTGGKRRTCEGRSGEPRGLGLLEPLAGRRWRIDHLLLLWVLVIAPLRRLELLLPLHVGRILAEPVMRAEWRLGRTSRAAAFVWRAALRVPGPGGGGTLASAGRRREATSPTSLTALAGGWTLLVHHFLVFMRVKPWQRALWVLRRAPLWLRTLPALTRALDATPWRFAWR